MHLHNKPSVLISPVSPAIYEALNKRGINTTFSKEVKDLIDYEKFHADMQLLVINDTAFIPKNVEGLSNIVAPHYKNVVVCGEISEKYPSNIALNAALVGNYLLCKASSLACEVTEYCKNNGIVIVNVNQGYTKCSTLVVNDNAIITADLGISRVAKHYGIDCLLINPGHIYLNGSNYGFIGGASVVIGDNIYFFGDINHHPDSGNILEFVKNFNMNSISLTSEILFDVGGAVILNK